MTNEYQAYSTSKAEARVGSLIASAEVRKGSHVKSCREKCEEKILRGGAGSEIFCDIILKIVVFVILYCQRYVSWNQINSHSKMLNPIIAKYKYM